MPVAHNVAVLVNGTNVFSGNIATYKQSVPFNFGTALNAGDTVDFVNYGLPDINVAYGLATGLAVNVANAAPPTVTTAISASGFGAFRDIAPGTLIEIYGSNLSLTTRGWTGNDFNGVNAPTSLDGTFVKIGGKPAFVNFISPLQINVVAPSDVPVGFQPITVTTAAGTSAAYNVMVKAIDPGPFRTVQLCFERQSVRRGVLPRWNLRAADGSHRRSQFQAGKARGCNHSLRYRLWTCYPGHSRRSTL